MSGSYKGVYVKITKDHKKMLSWLLDYTQDIERLADWLKTNVDTIDRWTSGETKKFREEGQRRLEKLHEECQTKPQEIAAEPNLLRGIFDRVNHVRKNMGEGRDPAAAAVLNDVVRDLAVYMIEHGEV